MVSKNQSQVVGSLKAKAGGNNNINNATGLPVNLGCHCLLFLLVEKIEGCFFQPKKNMVNLGGLKVWWETLVVGQHHS